MPRHLTVPRTLSGDAWIQVVRLHYRPGDAYDEHDHGFAEVFWIEDGEALHRVNGVDQRLGPGSLTLLRPADAHALAVGSRGFVMVNVTFRSELLASLRQRYADCVAPWPWDPSPLPFQAVLAAARLERLQRWADDLAAATGRLAAEAFLTDLLHLLGDRRPEIRPGLPPWLARAIERFQEPAQLARGPEALRRLSGRSVDHLNRAVRAAFGTTATDLANSIRLDHAAHLLRLTDRSIDDIAGACGFASVPHFYRAFQARHGSAPATWRRSHRAVGQGDGTAWRGGAAVPMGHVPTRR